MKSCNYVGYSTWQAYIFFRFNEWGILNSLRFLAQCLKTRLITRWNCFCYVSTLCNSCSRSIHKSPQKARLIFFFNSFNSHFRVVLWYGVWPTIVSSAVRIRVGVSLQTTSYTSIAITSAGTKAPGLLHSALGTLKRTSRYAQAFGSRGLKGARCCVPSDRWLVLGDDWGALGHASWPLARCLRTFLPELDAHFLTRHGAEARGRKWLRLELRPTDIPWACSQEEQRAEE